MAATVIEWLNLLVRWGHVLTGIMWIGSSIFFNWLDSSLDKVDDASREGVEGELWMVHGGGFYQVEKKLVAPEKLPPKLHWFKWEATFTLLTGLLLLDIVFYQGGAVTLVDPNVSSLGPTGATALCVGGLIGSWFVYDLFWRISAVSDNPKLGGIVHAAFVVGVAYFLTTKISGRAAFLHTGAMMGMWMAVNVWAHIIPNQKAIVAAVHARTSPDPRKAKAAKTRSRHNNYMTYPVVFIMLSNHFPGVYAHKYNWLILAGVMAVGVAIRHLENVRIAAHRELSPVIFIVVLGLLLTVTHSALTTEKAETGADPTQKLSASVPSSTGGPKVVANPAGVGSVKGTVSVDGNVPPPKQLNLGTCSSEHKGPVMSDAILVKGGKVQNAFVWIKGGLDDYKGPPAPAEPVVVDQRGCLYAPHVIGARVGQKVIILNSDPLLHNVRTVAEANPVFNEMMASKDMRLQKTFDKPEVMVRAKCDVHPWMSAFVGVVPHPFFAVTSETGEFSLQNVPAGGYVLESWHEAFGRREQPLVVKARDTVQADFAYHAE